MIGRHIYLDALVWKAYITRSVHDALSVVWLSSLRISSLVFLSCLALELQSVKKLNSDTPMFGELYAFSSCCFSEPTLSEFSPRPFHCCLILVDAAASATEQHHWTLIRSALFSQTVDFATKRERNTVSWSHTINGGSRPLPVSDYIWCPIIDHLRNKKCPVEHFPCMHCMQQCSMWTVALCIEILHLRTIIIELVDSVCRDSADTQYMLMQKNSQNLQNS